MQINVSLVPKTCMYTGEIVFITKQIVKFTQMDSTAVNATRNLNSKMAHALQFKRHKIRLKQNHKLMSLQKLNKNNTNNSPFLFHYKHQQPTNECNEHQW